LKTELTRFTRDPIRL